MSPHGAFGVLDGFGTVLAGADADRVLDADDEDLPVSHLAVARAPGDGKFVDHGRYDSKKLPGQVIRKGAANA